MLISSRGGSTSFGHLSLLALGVASPFERERGRGEGLLQASSTNGWPSKPLTSILSHYLRAEARESDVMLTPETDNQPTRWQMPSRHAVLVQYSEKASSG